MKRIAKVILIFVFIIGIFVMPSFATSYDFSDYALPYVENATADDIRENGILLFHNALNTFYFTSPFHDIYYFIYLENGTYRLTFVSDTEGYYSQRASDGTYIQNVYLNLQDTDTGVYYKRSSYDTRECFPSDILVFNSLADGLSAFSDFINTSTGSIQAIPFTDTLIDGLLVYTENDVPTYFYLPSSSRSVACGIYYENNGVTKFRACSLDYNTAVYYSFSGGPVVSARLTNGFTRYDHTIYCHDFVLYGDVNPDIITYDTGTPYIDDVYEFLSSLTPPAPSYTKNANVDAFLANTLISMGIKFESASDALSVGAAAWNYCTDENNLTDGDRLNKHDWDIDSFANIVNAHSNFYLNWYKGYKVNENVCLALTWYLYDNFESSAGLSQPRAGTLSGVSVTRDALYGYKGITNAATNYNMQSSYTFYSGSTMTYVNGSFVSETNLINGSQFLYEPSEVRRFIAFPPASVDDTSPDPNATGTLTNGDTTYDIDIQFPSLDWLKDLIIALIEAVTNLFTTIADFLSQILDAILGLFSDAFVGLEEFGAGIVDWITALFTGLSNLITGYLPNDIAAIIVAFISLNIGVGLIKFVLGKV